MEKTFFDEIISDFFLNSVINYRNNYNRGQLYWTHLLFTEDKLLLWRPRDYDDTKTYAAEFIYTSAVTDAFNRRIPLWAPPLEIDQEFIVVRAKRRPVILISPVPAKIDAQRIRGGGKINIRLCLVAPLYSVVDKGGRAKYTSEFVDRIRRLEFPHLFFIPENKAAGIRHSICRLDHFQVCFQNFLEPIDLSLSEDVLKVFQGQIECFLTDRYEGDYWVYRDSLLNIS